MNQSSSMSAQHTPGPRFDVMDGVNSPMRVAQWATREQVAAYCARVGRVIVSERRIGLFLSEIIVAKANEGQS